jgi:hypothetical protein
METISRTVHITRTCAICGKDFEVELLEETTIVYPYWHSWNFEGSVPYIYTKRKILTDCFYGGKIRFGVGNWSHSRAKQDENGNLVHDKDGLIIWEKCNPWWRELKYRLIDLKRTILHQYEDVEYWECSRCLNRIREENAKD